MVDILLGLQWGDEGKGKIVDYLAARYDVIARFQGGPNAGHTLYVEGKKVVLHTVPSGIFHRHCLNLIGSGVVIDPVTLREELRTVEAVQSGATDRLFVSQRAHLILPTHRALDAASEAAMAGGKIGSTLKGIGPAYMDKTGRAGLRVGDVLAPDFDDRYARSKEVHLRRLQSMGAEVDWAPWETPFLESIETLRSLRLVRGEYWLDAQLRDGKRVLAEGAQGSMLDIDFGTYPYVTSSNTIAGGACAGLGVAPGKIGEVWGISKAYATRVGGGPFPTEILDDTGAALRDAGGEWGATTGRPRRCGWLDLVALRYACTLSGVTGLILTKADVLDAFDPVRVATAYLIDGEETGELPYDLCTTEATPVYQSFPGWNGTVGGTTRYADLPTGFTEYCAFLESQLDTRVAYISTGPGRDELLEVGR